jgi:bifunctional DNase/RNase
VQNECLASGTVVDARPSDAVNLAAVSDVPVYVAAGLLEPFAQDAGGFFDAPPAR